MNNKIRIGIVGYGNLGRGTELALSENPDMKPIAVFTRRNPDTLDSKYDAVHVSKILDFKNKIDIMILCGGSAKDLDEQGPAIASHFNTVDSFDNHTKIPEYFEKMNKAAKQSSKLSLISVGWDPGLFSLIKLLGQSILPDGQNHTFWGDGLSQGHSDAIRKIKGVKNGVQYTVPIQEVLDKVRNYENINIPANKRHKRICYVCAEDGANLAEIENEIKAMPNYFAGYDTSVFFISEEELIKNHSKMPHGGLVIRTGITGKNNRQTVEFKLALDSNPEFTSSVVTAYARAVFRLAEEGKTGAISVFDVPFAYLSPLSNDELRKKLL